MRDGKAWERVAAIVWVASCAVVACGPSTGGTAQPGAGGTAGMLPVVAGAAGAVGEVHCAALEAAVSDSCAGLLTVRRRASSTAGDAGAAGARASDSGIAGGAGAAGSSTGATAATESHDPRCGIVIAGGTFEDYYLDGLTVYANCWLQLTQTDDDPYGWTFNEDRSAIEIGATVCEALLEGRFERLDILIPCTGPQPI